MNPRVQKALQSTQDAELGARYASWAARLNLRVSLSQGGCLAPVWDRDTVIQLLMRTSDFMVFPIASKLKQSSLDV